MKLLLLVCIAIALVSCHPQRKVDKNREIDVSINDIGSDKDFGKKETENRDTTLPISTTTDYNTPVVTTHKPQSAIARILDDIFQIPITVLQSVSKLLTNPFLGWNRDKTPENARGY